MEWCKEYELGIAEFDEEHQALVEAISVLEQSVNQRAALPELSRLIERLGNYLQVHFRVEEQRMRAYTYPGTLEHLAEHQGLLVRLNDWRSQAITRERARDIVALVAGWVPHHIMNSDHKLARFLETARAA